MHRAVVDAPSVSFTKAGYAALVLISSRPLFEPVLLAHQGLTGCLLHDLYPFNCAAEAQWNATEASADYTHNNVDHSFKSTKSTSLEAVFRALSLLLPDSL